jgi:hypothetical protein
MGSVSRRRREKECTDVFLKEASWKRPTLKMLNLGSG